MIEAINYINVGDKNIRHPMCFSVNYNKIYYKTTVHAALTKFCDYVII